MAAQVSSPPCALMEIHWEEHAQPIHSECVRLEAEMASSHEKSPDHLTAASPRAGRSADLILPTHRVKMIMKSCPDVETVPQESLHLITRATELFVQYLTVESLKQSPSKGRVDYEALSEVVDSLDQLDFLKEAIPKKITWAKARKLIDENSEKFENLI
ncbi:chromatin accessibility complex protein 1 [Macrobrachium rosenbergii]|uniref:chromatin accessibility complex protein 1 n=1 Tax=Macrobrachium rosenbergii TaxID=79674 RepID=UPI0034D73772